MSFEDAVIKGVDKGRETLSPLMEEAYTRANLILDKYQIDEGDFVDLYGDGVKIDKQRVEDREKSFNPENYAKKISKIAEAIILEQGELSEWFGPDIETLKSSRFDDYFNGSDIILKKTDDESEQAQHVSLGVDVTFGTGEQVEAKIDRIVGDIRSGSLSKVKYLKRSNSESSFVPHVIVGADIETIEELARFWISNKKKELARHRIRYTLLDEIRIQLQIFAEFAKDVGQKQAEESYREVLEIVEDILKNRDDAGDGHMDRDGAINDKVYQLIKAKVSTLSHELK